MSKITQAPDEAARRARLATFVAFFLQGALFASILTRLPAFEDERGIDEGDVTILLLLASVLAGVGSLVAEQIAVRRSSATALRLALVVICVMAPVAAFAPAGVAMMLAFSLYGVGVGAVDASMNMQGVTIQRLYGRSIMTAFHGLWSIGAICGAGYTWLTERLDIPLEPSIVSVGVLGLVAALAVGRWFVRPAVEHEVTAQSETSARSATRVPWRPMLALALVIVVFYFADTGVASWGTLYLRNALAASTSVAALGYGAYQVGAVVSRIVGDRFVVRHGAERVVQVGTLIGTVGLLAVVVSPTPAVAIGAFLIMGLGLPVVAPLAFAAAGNIPGTDADVAIARLNIFNYVGTILGAALLGPLADADLWRMVFVVPLLLVPLILVVARAFAPADDIEAAAEARP